MLITPRPCSKDIFSGCVRLLRLAISEVMHKWATGVKERQGRMHYSAQQDYRFVIRLR